MLEEILDREPLTHFQKKPLQIGNDRCLELIFGIFLGPSNVQEFQNIWVFDDVLRRGLFHVLLFQKCFLLISS
jgi:hypothetical protein